MKKLISLLLVLVMVGSLAACGTGSPSASSEEALAESAAESKEEAPAESAAEAAESTEAPAAEAAADDTFRIGIYVQMSGENSPAGLAAKRLF